MNLQAAQPLTIGSSPSSHKFLKFVKLVTNQHAVLCPRAAHDAEFFVDNSTVRVELDMIFSIEDYEALMNA